tara:strand:- start:741 stop:929 length:189 start_codon:yes stop_codon:yes gene_type:complete
MAPKVIAFSKALRLIDGCVKRIQLDAAKRYIDLFEKMFAIDRNSRQMVDILNMKLKERRKLL